MATPYLVADSAQVTVLRSLASTAFGKYGLKLPEGVDLEDVYEVAAPGNELAYVSSLGGNRRVGGMFRRFVRADVNVTAQGEDMVPASDVERVLDEAAKRVSGDFFLESDISKAGLGPWVPMVDFHVGDIANVEIWGRVVPLAVTRIEPKRTEHSDNDWSVHVGGQLLSDSEARLAENTNIYNAVVSDRRELAGLETKTSQAVAAASRAQSTADSARDEVAAVRDTLAGEQAQEPDLLSQLVAVNDELQRLGQDPQPSLMLAFVSLSTALWEAQQEINAQQLVINRQQQLINDQQAEINAQQKKINEQTRELAEANRTMINLLHLNNHGAWSLSKKYTLKKNTWTELHFGKPKGDPVGCEQGTLDDSEGSFVRFLEAGQWEVSARFYVPGRKLVAIGGGTELGLVHMRSGQQVDYAEAIGYDDGWFYTLSIRTVFNVQERDYMYVRAKSGSDRGDGPLSQANTNDAYSELIVRQLSRG